MVAAPVMTRAAFFAAWEKTWAQRSAFLFREKSTTKSYEDFFADVQSCAARLHAADLSFGDYLGVYGLGREETLTVFAACLLTGIVFVPVPDKYPLQRLDFFTAQVPCKRVITTEKYQDFLCWNEWLTTEPKSWQGSEIADGPAMVIFTSGSSGAPKGVELSWSNLFFSAVGSNAFYALTPEDIWLLNLPLFHVGGLMVAFRCWLAGAAVELAAEETTEEVLASSRATMFSLVPTQLQRALQNQGALNVLRQAKAILLGGAPTSAALMEAAQKQNVPVSITYGASECCAQLTATRPGAPWRSGLVGGALTHRDVRLKQGRMAFRGATRFQGYWRDGTLQKPFDAEGWFVTEDEAAVRVDGQFIVLGRADDVFQSGGENIAPREIEEILNRLNGVGEWLVFPQPDREYGAVPVAIFWGPSRPELAPLKEMLQTHLPGLKRPRVFYWLPSQEQMKPERGMLKAAFAAGSIPADLHTLL